MSKAKKAVLIGWNGKCNLGDDLMTWCILKQLSLNSSIKEVLIWAESKELPKYRILADLKIRGIHGFDKKQRIKGLRSLINRYYIAPRELKEVDLIIVGGGSIFHSANGILNVFRIVNVAKKNNPNVKMVTCSVSLGPFNSTKARIATASLLSQFDAVGLRDLRSLNEFQNLNIDVDAKVFPDIAMSYPSLITSQNREPLDRIFNIGISLRYNFVNEQVINVITNTINALQKIHPKLVVVILELSDYHMARDSDERMSLLDVLKAQNVDAFRIVTYDTNYEGFYAEMKNLNFVICMRLHAAIISYATQTRFCIIPYHQKSIDFKEDNFPDLDELLFLPTDDKDCLENKLNKLLSVNKKRLFENHLSVVEDAKAQVAWLIR